MNDFNKFDEVFQQMKRVKRSEQAKQTSWAKLNHRMQKNRFNFLPSIVIVLATIVTISIAAIMMQKAPMQNASVMTDENTVQEIPFIESIEAPMYTIEYLSDTMDWGKHDYTEYDLVIDPEAYLHNKIKRGDVILYRHINGEEIVGRIIALPGEEVSIQEGQFFINHQKLATFYGEAHRVGMDRKTYDDKMKENRNYSPEIFEEEMDLRLLKEEEYFVAGDDWLRSSKLVLNETDILGQVLGYMAD